MKRPSDHELLIFEAMELEQPLDVLYKDETLWLNQHQIEILFSTDRSSIVKHINNIYKTDELEQKATCAKIAQVRIEGGRKVTRNLLYYNLDMIISVGYRVNSIRGTQFRIWATKVLKEHLIQGYTINEKLMQRNQEQIESLKKTISLLERTVVNQLSADKEVYDLLKVISDYAQDLQLLDDYDNQSIPKPEKITQDKSALTNNEVLKVIKQLKDIHKERLFGRAKDNSLDSCINAIYQTFDGKDLYTSVQEKAANLLYLLVKNHPFVDGNKRIAASIFLYFLNKNQILYDTKKGKLLSDGVLAALTLLVAESKPQEKAIMISLIMYYL